MGDGDLPVGPIRGALELAWAVARQRSQTRPPMRIPGRIRPLVNVARLPNRMLSSVRQAVEEDDEFRADVAKIATEELVGRASLLWLTRPDGWQDELAELVAPPAESDEAVLRRDLEAAHRRIAALEGTAIKAEAELAVIKEATEGVATEVAGHRQGRRRAETEAGRLRAELAAAGDTTLQLTAELEQLRQTLASVEAHLDEARRDRGAAEDAAAGIRAQADRTAEALGQVEAEAARAQALADARRAAAVDSIAVAALATEKLATALSDAAEALGLKRDQESPVVPAPDAAPAPTPASVRPPRRSPVPIPLGLFHDSPEAADHLVRVPGILLVVDGYNITLTAWPDLDLPEQRRRLVDALAELVLRSTPTVHLVFDGVDAGGRLHPPPPARRLMRVEFSATGTEADEVIIDLVDRLDPLQPVVVATNDRRVQLEVQHRGANVMTVEQLLGVLGRLPGAPSAR